MSHDRTLAMGLMAAALGCSSIFAVSCADHDGADHDGETQPADESKGALRLALEGPQGLAGFLVEIKSAVGDVVASKLLTTTYANASTFLSLPPGKYTVWSTPMLGPEQPHPACTVAKHQVTIRAGKTSAVTLLSQCQSSSVGGVDIGVGANFAPQLLSVTMMPSTPLTACEAVTLMFEARDPEGDRLTCDATFDSGSPFDVATAAGAEPNTVVCAVRLEPQPGEHTVTVTTCDAEQCANLEVPLHVSGAACVPRCDDANPCTSDVASSDGFCSSRPVADGSLCSGGSFRVKVLGFNDFHGQLETGRVVAGRPVGGAAVLASYLKSAQSGIEDQTIIVHAGDHVGASPPASALLQDEPSISFLNLLANEACSAADRLNPACNVVGTVGNHEFDEGMNELLRLLSGGNFATGPFLEDPFPGALFPYVSANVIERATNQPLLRPFVVKELHGVKLGVIGAVLKQTPTIVTPSGVAGLTFLDEADAINAQATALKELGIRAQIVTIHQGGFQSSYIGPTRAASLLTSGSEIQNIVSRLDDEIDVVISGHSHAFTNVLLPNANGKQILVVQAFSASTAYDDIDLLIDPASGDVVSKTAQIVTTFGDAGPGLTPDADVAALVQKASERVAPLVNQVFGNAPAALTRVQSAAGESKLGDLIADSQLAAQGSQFVFMNPGGIRQDLDAGDITFGDLFTIQPFGNTLVQMTMTGAQIIKVLEQQWVGQTSPKMLQVAGFEYTWNPAAPVGSRIVEVRLGGVAIDPAASYTVTCNNFLAGGGDNFLAFKEGTNQIGGPIDLDALIEYIEHLGSVVAPAGPRIFTL